MRGLVRSYVTLAIRRDGFRAWCSKVCPLKQLPDKSRGGFQFEDHYIYEMDVNTGQDIGIRQMGKCNLRTPHNTHDQMTVITWHIFKRAVYKLRTTRL
jgi:hypothetical protein